MIARATGLPSGKTPLYDVSLAGGPDADCQTRVLAVRGERDRRFNDLDPAEQGRADISAGSRCPIMKRPPYG
jgi:hypothetical protein